MEQAEEVVTIHVASQVSCAAVSADHLLHVAGGDESGQHLCSNLLQEDRGPAQHHWPHSGHLALVPGPGLGGSQVTPGTFNQSEQSIVID